MKVAVLGAGAWGTAISCVLAARLEVALWARDPDQAARCFFASVISVCHPQVVAQCLKNPNRATPEELAEFAIRALKA